MAKKPPSLWSYICWSGIRRGLADWWWSHHTSDGKRYWRNA